MHIQFLLNGEVVNLDFVQPATTLLDWLRETMGLTGTKEGCNEGDCGACTVMVSDRVAGEPRHRALNACILMLPQLHHKAIRTVEGLESAGGLHPVQEAMMTQHGSQCGFCTPGFVMSLIVAHTRGRRDHDTVLAGNLCRCTGYQAIVRAAQVAENGAIASWVAGDQEKLDRIGRTPVSGEGCFVPDDLGSLADWYAAHPEATVVAGATDVGLWVTKRLEDITPCTFVSGVAELREISERASQWWIGAGVTIAELQHFIQGHFADFALMLNRFGSVQVREAATVGGNIANGSPIGDTPPALIALGASVHLRHGLQRRRLMLEDFFLDYGRQDRAPGELIEAISVPKQLDYLRCYKVSKRIDQDISALCGCFQVLVEQGRVQRARIAFGGMAGIPKRARHTEAALEGVRWSAANVSAAARALSEDFSPLSDFRASAAYRLRCAQGLLQRYYIETATPEICTRIHAVTS